MLVCGKFETELDFRIAPSMRESLIAANLIGDRTDKDSLRAYSWQLILLVIKDILPGQPISLRRLDEYIVSAKNVFNRVLLSNDIPVTDMPPCLLTKLMCRKDDAIKNYWITCIDRNCDVLPIEYAITIAFSMLIGKVAGYCQL
jgi:hypothetical protein